MGKRFVMPKVKNEEILIPVGSRKALVWDSEPSLTVASKFPLLLLRSHILLMTTVNGFFISHALLHDSSILL
jgi:hypothetical protein